MAREGIGTTYEGICPAPRETYFWRSLKPLWVVTSRGSQEIWEATHVTRYHYEPIEDEL